MLFAVMLLASSLLILVPYASSLSFHQRHLELTSSSSSHALPLSPAVKARPTIVYRPRSLEALHRTRLRSLYHAQSELEPLIWDPVNISGPDIEDLHTLTQLARMSANAYASPEHKTWYDVDNAWNYVRPPCCLNLSILLIKFLYYRVFRLVGRVRMVSGVMSFYLLIIPLLCSP